MVSIEFDILKFRPMEPDARAVSDQDLLCNGASEFPKSVGALGAKRIISQMM